MDDWLSGSLKDSTVVPQVDAIAVYTNLDGLVVIRQRSQIGEDDAFIAVPKGSVAALIKALKEEAGRK
jgi:hypothetical protein